MKCGCVRMTVGSVHTLSIKYAVFALSLSPPSHPEVLPRAHNDTLSVLLLFLVMSPIFRSYISLVLLSALLLPMISATLNASCSDYNCSTVNATSPVLLIPPLWNNLQGSHGTNSTWTVSTGIQEVLDPGPGDNSLFMQSWWIDTDPVITTSASQLPFDSCVFQLLLLPPFRTLRSSTDGNTCNGIFNDECYHAILDLVNSNVTNLAGGTVTPVAGDLTEDGICASLQDILFNTVPSPCQYGMAEIAGIGK